MKSIIVSLLLSVGIFQCDNGGGVPDCDLPVCDGTRKTVKKVTDQEGRIDYSQEEKKWLIISAAGKVTYDAQDVGIVCGDLEESLKQVGTEVKFSGEYKQKCGDNKGPLVGQTYYYLHISKIEDLTNG